MDDLGEFAMFLDGDPLSLVTQVRPSEQARIDELKAKQNEASYMIKYEKNVEKLSPSKIKPNWVFGRPKFPRITRKPMANAEELKEIPGCGHTCPDCINNYRC